MTVVTRTILYVDDEPALCRAFERALRGPGVKIVTTTSAPHAVELLDSERFDVVATDYRMPELNGIEILRAARARAPGARRLLVSGRIDGEVDNDVLADADVDGVVIKPWSLDELRRVVRRAAELAVLTRERAQLIQERRSRELGLLVSALELRDAGTAAHARRTARLARLLAEELGILGEELRVVEDAALAHDIGKLGLCDGLLHKDEDLTPEEWAAMREHPMVGARLLDGLDVLPGTTAIVRQHHERVDGAGYPLGLKGTEIVLGARVIAVVDAYDDMRSERGRRAARTPGDAAAELRRCAGSHFDAEVVEAFLALGLERIESLRSE
jgi:putative nucleotidyltransferase with HDIG domain